ncbi:hypothetical protein [Nocardioides sp. Root190]|uniref:hypothetical protein n=1 Tax=Nocardioides sp. Root190 TaxID=1736488 RepID=UPI000B253027|nr:hypothetical protein [Nocardioides sp. Root190]
MFTSNPRSGSTYRDAQEWGPAKHDPDHPFRLDLLETPAFGTALRDGDDAFPEDN